MPRKKTPVPAHPALPGLQSSLGEAKRTGGALYQAVGKQVAALKAAGVLPDDDTREAQVAVARHIAASIDVAAAPPQASGMQLAALYAQLREALVDLAPAAPSDDPFTEFLKDLEHDDAPASHPQE